MRNTQGVTGKLQQVIKQVEEMDLAIAVLSTTKKKVLVLKKLANIYNYSSQKRTSCKGSISACQKSINQFNKFS